jgi:hypothetical protein
MHETYKPKTHTWTTGHTWYILRKDEPFINNANKWGHSLMPVGAFSEFSRTQIEFLNFPLQISPRWIYVAVETWRKKHCYSDRAMLPHFQD